MVNGIRASDPRGLNKGRGLKFCVGSRVRQETSEGRKTHWLKREYNKDEDNSPKTLNDKKFLYKWTIHFIPQILVKKKKKL